MISPKDDYQLGFGTRTPTWYEILKRTDIEARMIVQLIKEQVAVAQAPVTCEEIYNEVDDYFS